jgi:hypothetical protein
MAKVSEVDTGEALLEALNAHIEAMTSGSREVAVAGADEGFEWPELTEINAMKLPALIAVGENIELDLEDKKLGEARKLVATARAIALDEDVDDLDEDDVNALAEALDIEPASKLSKTIAALAEFFSDEGAEAEEEKPKKKGKKVVEEESDEDEPKSKKKKAKADADEDDGVDREEKAGEVDLDEEDEDDMRERLEAYNEAQDDEEKQIEIPKKGGKVLQEAYRKLVQELVDSDGDVAEWGEPYARNDQAWCCGMPLVEATVKGIEEDCGKCQVTGKIFKTDSEGDLVEVKKKGKSED